MFGIALTDQLRAFRLELTASLRPHPTQISLQVAWGSYWVKAVRASLAGNFFIETGAAAGLENWKDQIDFVFQNQPD